MSDRETKGPIAFLFSSLYEYIIDFENDSQMQKLRLSDAKTGSNLKIVGVQEPDNAHVLRLCELGFVPGALLSVQRNRQNKSPMIVDINDVRMCLEMSLAQYFWVES